MKDDPVNKLMYHYTTVGALSGMLENTTIDNKMITFWATHMGFMNDPEELVFGINLFMTVVESIEEDLHIPEERRIGNIDKRGIKSRLMDDFIISNSPLNLYSVSFSEAADNLHMWNMYGANGNGLCLGFQKDLLDKYLNNTSYNLQSITYGEPENRSWVQKLKDFYSQQYHKLCEDVKKKPLMPEVSFADIMYSLISRYTAMGIKNPAYIEEQEWRIYYDEPEELSRLYFRNRNGIIIPYIKVQIPLEALRIIRLGPTADADRGLTSIMKFMFWKLRDIDPKLLTVIQFHLSHVPLIL